MKNFITDDYEYILIGSADASNKGYIFKLDSGTSQFVLSETLILDAQIKYLSLSEDKEWLAVSTHGSSSDPGNEKTYIFTGLTAGSIVLQQTFYQNSYHHSISQDKQYFIVTSEVEKVFVDCRPDNANNYFNQTSGECL